MYAYIKGQLTHLEPNHAIVETHGIGYRILIPLSTYSQLSASIGKDIFLHLEPVYREDNQILFGFHDDQAKALFTKIRDISGIGPKTALAIIGHMDLDTLSWALAKQDTATLAKIPGIGKKTAQRLIVELQGKVTATPTKESTTSTSQDAISALMQLGYPLDRAQKAVTKALKETPDSTELSALITTALQHT